MSLWGCKGLAEVPAGSQGCGKCPLCAVALTGTWLCSVPWAVGPVPRPRQEDREPWGIPLPPCPRLCSPPAPHCQLWHTSTAASSPVFFFFSSSFLLGVGRGEEGAGGSVCQCGCWVIKPCTNLCAGLPAPPSRGAERVLGTRSQADPHSGTSPLAPAGPKPALRAGRDDSKLTEPLRQMG